MAARADMLRDETIRCQASLGLSCGLQSLHPPLSLTRRLMRAFPAIVAISMLAVLHTRHEISLGSFAAFQLIGDRYGITQSQAKELVESNPSGRVNKKRLTEAILAKRGLKKDAK